MNAYRLVDKPWGKFEQFTLNEETTIKILYVNAEHRLSYQYHSHRLEFWKVISGEVQVVVNGRRKTLGPGDSIEIPVRAKHRIEGIKDSMILEIASGAFDENDIVRIDDDYGRAKQICMELEERKKAVEQRDSTLQEAEATHIRPILERTEANEKLRQREAQIQAAEDKLAQRSMGLTALENDLNDLRQQLDAAKETLSAREADLLRREEALKTREAELPRKYDEFEGQVTAVQHIVEEHTIGFGELDSRELAVLERSEQPSQEAAPAGPSQSTATALEISPAEIATVESKAEAPKVSVIATQTTTV